MITVEVDVSIRARRRCVRWMFQSAPAITGGRSGRSMAPKTTSRRFNPRPPSLAGDPRGHPEISQG